MDFALLFLVYWLLLLLVWTVPSESIVVWRALERSFRFDMVLWRVGIAVLAAHVVIAAVLVVPLPVVRWLVPHDFLWAFGITQVDRASKRAELCGAVYLFAASYLGGKTERTVMAALLRRRGFTADCAAMVNRARRWSGVGRWAAVLGQLLIGR